MTRVDAVVARLDRLPVLAVLGVAALAVALTLRSLEGKTFLYGDLQHFFAFADVLYTPDHFNYYASVSDQNYTYAHLPLFPMLLAPLQRAFDALGWDRILAVKVIVHVFEVATAWLLTLLARRQGLSRPLALGIGILWLFTPWVFEAGALNGHASAVAAFFLVAAVLRLKTPWQAGVLVGLSVVTFGIRPAGPRALRLLRPPGDSAVFRLRGRRDGDWCPDRWPLPDSRRRRGALGRHWPPARSGRWATGDTRGDAHTHRRYA